MTERGLPPPEFTDSRGTFSVCLRCDLSEPAAQAEPTPVTGEMTAKIDDPKGLLTFCRKPRTRGEIIAFLEIPSVSYALKRYLDPLVKGGMIGLSIPDRPKSPKQTYQTVVDSDEANR